MEATEFCGGGGFPPWLCRQRDASVSILPLGGLSLIDKITRRAGGKPEAEIPGVLLQDSAGGLVDSRPTQPTTDSKDRVYYSPRDETVILIDKSADRQQLDLVATFFT